jgi:hypothetical protein
MLRDGLQYLLGKKYVFYLGVVEDEHAFALKPFDLRIIPEVPVHNAAAGVGLCRCWKAAKECVAWTTPSAVPQGATVKPG